MVIIFVVFKIQFWHSLNFVALGDRLLCLVVVTTQETNFYIFTAVIIPNIAFRFIITSVFQVHELLVLSYPLFSTAL
jgi:hypothetical protein